MKTSLSAYVLGLPASIKAEAAFDRIMLRDGGEPPREGHEIPTRVSPASGERSSLHRSSRPRHFHLAASDANSTARAQIALDCCPERSTGVRAALDARA